MALHEGGRACVDGSRCSLSTSFIQFNAVCCHLLANLPPLLTWCCLLPLLLLHTLSMLLLPMLLQDFIFVGQGASASGFGVVPDKQENGCCPSDHKPIVAEVSF